MRHAKANEVSVDIRPADPRGELLSIEIREDGTGFRPESGPQGRGIDHMKLRAEALDARIRFESDASGTRIELRVAIPDARAVSRD